MPKDSNAIVPTKTELLPPQQATAEEIFRKMVAERVDEIMADKRASEFAPFHETSEVAEAVRKVQTVTERRKWGYYFEEFGCLVCGTKATKHRSTGMCAQCFNRIRQRLYAIRRKLAEQLSEPEVTVKEAVAFARRAVSSSVQKAVEKSRES